MTETVNLHCAMCEGPVVFTILRGDALCQPCYGQRSKAYSTIDDINLERDASIQEIKKKVNELYDLILSNRYRS